MDTILDNINQILHNKGITKQNRLSIIIKIIKNEETLLDNSTENTIKLLINKLNFNEDVIQNLFMLLGEKLLKKSLDQYYTPKTIGNFISNSIVSNNNISVLEPACGTGDLVINVKGKNFTFQDISNDACELLELNLILNKFDSPYQIKNCNSLLDTSNKYSIVVINPPFGTKTVETNKEILDKYFISNGKKKEQLGKLFVEFGLKSLEDKGLLFIILPLGYLTNSTEFGLRKFIIDNYRLIAIIELPQNTFKKSGTGVDTCILIIENRKCTDNYNVFISYFDENITTKLKYFSSHNKIKLLSKSKDVDVYNCITKDDIINNNYSMSIRRYDTEYLDIIVNIQQKQHFTLNNYIIKNKIKPTNKDYIYLDISEIGKGTYNTTNIIHGSLLPNRATYSVCKNDICISKLKGEISFCIICDDYENIIVTNGVFIFSISDEIKRFSLYKYLFTTEFNKQFNSLTGGSIMADIKEIDICNNIFIPELENIDDIRLMINSYNTFHNIRKKIE